MTAGLSAPEIAAWYAGIVLCLVLIVRLALAGLFRHYKAFALFLIVSASRSILLATVPFNTNAYAEAYLLTMPLIYLSLIWLVLEIYGYAFENLRGIAMLGRWTIIGALLIGAVFAVGTTLLDHDPAREPFPMLGLVFRLEAIVVKILVAFSLLICAVLGWFPIPQRPNVILIGFAASAWFISLGASLVVRGLNPSGWTRLASTSALYVYALCMAIWLVKLRKKESDVPTAQPIPSNAEEQGALAEQLRTMNRALESLRKAG